MALRARHSHQQVGALEITMHDAAAVQVRHATRRVQRKSQSLARVERARLPVQHVAKTPLHVLRHHGGRPLALHHAQHAHHIGVLQRADERGFAAKGGHVLGGQRARGGIGRRRLVASNLHEELGPDGFDRHLHPAPARTVHLAVRARAQPLQPLELGRVDQLKRHRLPHCCRRRLRLRLRRRRARASPPPLRPRAVHRVRRRRSVPVVSCIQRRRRRNRRRAR